MRNYKGMGADYPYMARDGRSDVTQRTTDLSEFEQGDWVRVHYRTSRTADSSTLKGKVDIHYHDQKVLLDRISAGSVVLDLSDTSTDGGLREFRDGSVIGRPMFAEPVEVEN